VVEDMQKQSDERPLITVAMPVYNAGKYLRMAVLSIVKQTFTDWELLIIDDGSTDSAFHDIADINDARIRICRDGENKGLAARLNECIDLARGKYLARMDQDDVSYPERFARQIAALQNDSMLDLVATRAITIDENNQATGLFPYAISHKEICAQPWRGFYLTHPTWMGRTEWFRKHRYTVPGPYFCEDQDLLLRSYRDSRFGTLDEILFAYRIRSKINWQKLAKTRRTVFIAQLRHFAGLNLWHFVLLATATFFAKMSSDLLKRMQGDIFKPGCNVADDDVKFKWHKVLEYLAAGAT
jgi:glycosyltransferase involved in cell wall biosynthesis